jgi:hypothetical protein
MQLAQSTDLEKLELEPELSYLPDRTGAEIDESWIVNLPADLLNCATQFSASPASDLAGLPNRRTPVFSTLAMTFAVFGVDGAGTTTALLSDNPPAVSRLQLSG